MPEPYRPLPPYHNEHLDESGGRPSSYVVQIPSTSECHQTCGADRHHIPIPVLPALLALTLVQIGLLVAVFLVPVFSETLPISTNAFSVLQYLYVVCWAIISFLSWCIVNEFHRIWLLGYHQFHRTTKHLHAASFFIYTGGLVLYTVLATAVRDYCPAGALGPCGEHVHLVPVNYQQIIVVALTLCSFIFNIKLMNDVYRFNQQELPPDVLVDDLGVRLSQASSFAGAGDRDVMCTILDAQGCMIDFLRDQLTRVNQQGTLLAHVLEQQHSDP